MQSIEQSILNLVPITLENYLSNTRLSMEQIANKWKTSSAMLSQIKNGKKRAGVDLGLRILRESGISIDKRKKWLEERQQSSSNELVLVQKELKQKKVAKDLNEDFCRQLECNPILLDIFLDIAISEGKGVTWNSIFKNYGDYGIELTSTLMSGELIIFENSKYYINDENNIFHTNPESSFGIVKALISKQQTNKKKGCFKGELQFDVTDISHEAFDELIDLNKKYVKEVRNIIEKNEVHRFSGGVRVVCQSLIALAKGVICLFLVLNLSSNNSFAGGLRGGSSSDKSLGGVRGGDSERNLNSNDLRALVKIRKPKDFRLRFDDKYTFVLKKLSSNELYQDKKSAIDAAVELNEKIKIGDIDKELYYKLRIGLMSECQNTTFNNETKRAIAKGGIHPIGFTVSESFSPDGIQLYSYLSKFYFPCKIKK